MFGHWWHDGLGQLRGASLASQFTTESLLLLKKAGCGKPVGWKNLATHLALVAVFGVMLPWMKGVEFMDPALPAVYACLGPLFAAPALVQMLREGYPDWTGMLAKIGAATLYGELLTVAILVLGLATVLLSHRQAYLFLPDPILMGEALLLGLGLTLAFAALAAWITLQFSPRVAISTLRVSFLLLFVLFFLRSWWLPRVAGWGALVAFAAAGFVLLLLRWMLVKHRPAS